MLALTPGGTALHSAMFPLVREINLRAAGLLEPQVAQLDSTPAGRALQQRAEALVAQAGAALPRADPPRRAFRAKHGMAGPTWLGCGIPVAQWMAQRGWQPFAFQREVWAAVAQGRSGLLHATTGSGKTYAVWLGMLGAAAAPPAPAGPGRAAAARAVAHADARAGGRHHAGAGRAAARPGAWLDAGPCARATRPRPSVRARTGAFPRCWSPRLNH
jgi:hypothetical protein